MGRIKCLFLFILPVLLQASLCSKAAAQATPDKRLVIPNTSLALPVGCSVKVRWVCPPLDPQAVEKSLWYSLSFTVDRAGNPYIGYQDDKIVSPVKQYRLKLPQRYTSLACLENGALLATTDDDLCFVVPPKGFQDTYDKIPAALYQPIANMPAPEGKLYPGSGDSVYFVAPRAGGGNDVFLILHDKVGVRGFDKVFTSKVDVSAVAGDGKTTFVAMGRAIVKVPAVGGTVSKVYANSGEYIRQMAYSPATGLFYCTSEGVNRIGAKGRVPLMSTPDARISLQKGTLYVLLSKTLGVLALDGVKDLKRFDKAFKEVPVTQLPDARITGVRFFEAGKDLPESGDRKYATQFDHQTTRFVYCQADLENLQYNKRSHRETVTMELYRAGRDEPLQSESMSFDCRKDYASMWGWAKFGSDDAGTLYPRPYTVKVYLNGTLVNESKFTVTGEPSLLEAAGYHDAAAVNKLIKSGADVNMTGKDGTTPLMFAALVSDAEIAKLLLASGAKVNARRADGQTALLMDGETWSDDPTIAGLLLNAGAEIDARDNEGRTALHKATNKGKEKVIKLLLDRGAGVGVKDNEGLTPLLAGNWRFGTHDKAVVRTTEMLLARGADPEAQDTYGKTALFSAVDGRNIDIVSALIKRGADVNAAGKIYGTTERSVLGYILDQYRVFRPYRYDRVRLVEIGRLLQEKGADLNTSEFAQAYFRGVDEVLDARHMARLLEMSELAARDCQPDDPSLRKADIRGLLNAACREILDAKDEYAYYSALNLCEEAGNRARKWGLSSSCPEISFNMGLIYMQIGSSSNATKYFREYLAMSPTGPCAARARELINQMD